MRTRAIALSFLLGLGGCGGVGELGASVIGHALVSAIPQRAKPAPVPPRPRQGPEAEKPAPIAYPDAPAPAKPKPLPAGCRWCFT